MMNSPLLQPLITGTATTNLSVTELIFSRITEMFLLFKATKTLSWLPSAPRHREEEQLIPPRLQIDIRQEIDIQTKCAES